MVAEWQKVSTKLLNFVGKLFNVYSDLQVMLDCAANGEDAGVKINASKSDPMGVTEKRVDCSLVWTCIWIKYCLSRDPYLTFV